MKPTKNQEALDIGISYAFRMWHDLEEAFSENTLYGDKWTAEKIRDSIAQDLSFSMPCTDRQRKVAGYAAWVTWKQLQNKRGGA